MRDHPPDMRYPYESEQAVAAFYHNFTKPKRKIPDDDKLKAAVKARAEKVARERKDAD